MSHFPTVNNQPMVELVADHLASGKSLTAVEAQAMWRCRSLTKRISELRQRGHDIVAEWRKDSTGQRYVRYSIA